MNELKPYRTVGMFSYRGIYLVSFSNKCSFEYLVQLDRYQLNIISLESQLNDDPPLPSFMIIFNVHTFRSLTLRLLLLHYIVIGSTLLLLENSTHHALSIFDQIFNHLQDSNDILHFHGHKTFEYLRNAAAVEIGGVIKYKRWSEITTALTTTTKRSSNFSNSTTFALRLHNDLKLGDFLQLITHPHLHKKFRIVEKVSVNRTLESLITKQRFDSYFDLRQPPIVLTNVIDENWGFLSTVIVNRTTRWINLTNHLLIHDHSYRTLGYFFDSPKVYIYLCFYLFCHSHCCG